MPIIPRFQQEADPNQPPRIDFGDRLMQGMMAGSQMQRAQAEAEWRKSTAARYQKEAAREDEALNASAQAALFEAERKFGGGIAPRPEQFMPGDQAQQESPYATEMGDYTKFIFGEPKSQPMTMSDASPVSAPSPVNISSRQGMMDLDAADRADYQAALDRIQQLGGGPVTTRVILEGLNAASIERRQQFDIQQLQARFQDSIIGIENIGAESPLIKEAVAPLLERLRTNFDQLDDQMSPQQRNELVKQFGAQLDNAIQVATQKREQVTQHGRSLALARQARDSYEPTNPNARLWTNVETALALNPQMPVEQISDLVQSARFKEQGYKQDPFTGGWFSEKEYADRMDSRRRAAASAVEARKDRRQKSMDKWYESRPDYADITREADSAYSAQFESTEEVDPTTMMTVKRMKPRVDKVKSREEIFDEVEQRMENRWLAMRPAGRRAGREAAGPVAPSISSAVSGLDESEFDGAERASTGPVDTTAPGKEPKLAAGVGSSGRAPTAAKAFFDMEAIAQERTRREPPTKPSDPLDSLQILLRTRGTGIDPWEQESMTPFIRHGEEVAISVPTDSTNFVRRMLGMNPLGYDFYGEPTLKEIEDRRYELERQAAADAKAAERYKTQQEKEAAKAKAEESKAKYDQFVAVQKQVEDSAKVAGEQGATAGRAYLRGLQEQSSRADEQRVKDQKSKDAAKAKSDLARMMGLPKLPIGRDKIDANVRKLLASESDELGIVELEGLLVGSGLYSQRDIIDMRRQIRSTNYK